MPKFYTAEQMGEEVKNARMCFNALVCLGNIFPELSPTLETVQPLLITMERTFKADPFPEDGIQTIRTNAKEILTLTRGVLRESFFES